MKRLCRSKTNRVFAGVCGGIGDYLNIDPVAIRLMWVLFIIFTAVIPGIIAYLIAVLIIPLEKVVVREGTASEVN